MRAFLACLLLGAELALPLYAASAQTPAMPRIGWLSIAAAEDAEISPFFEAFRQELRSLGYVEGRSIAIDARWANGDMARGTDHARDLAAQGVNLIVSQGVAIRIARTSPASVPVVFAVSADPVSAGLVESLARPGGNMTGVTFLSSDVNVKRIELLREAFPGIKRIALLSNPDHAGESIELRASRDAASALGLDFQYVPVRSAAEFEPAFAAITEGRAEAIVVLSDVLMMQYRARVIGFAAQQRLPTISGWRAFADSGGMITYGPNLRESYRVLARSVDRILKGAKPSELPVEQPATFELTVNLRTAKALGIEIPQSVLARADAVIE